MKMEDKHKGRDRPRALYLPLRSKTLAKYYLIPIYFMLLWLVASLFSTIDSQQGRSGLPTLVTVGEQGGGGNNSCLTLSSNLWAVFLLLQSSLFVKKKSGEFLCCWVSMHYGRLFIYPSMN